MKLNIFELHRTLESLKNKNTECFEKIIQSCHKKIITYTKNNKLNCFYEVPLYVIGFPIFDINKCIEYIKKSLEEDGFLVKYYFPKYLYISWDFNEINEHKLILKNKQKELNRIEKQSHVDNNVFVKSTGKLQLNLF